MNYYRVKKIVDNVTMDDPLRKLSVVVCPMTDGVNLAVSMPARDRDDPTKSIDIEDCEMVHDLAIEVMSQEALETYVLVVLRNLAQKLVSHEVSEWFLYKNERTFEPHYRK